METNKESAGSMKKVKYRKLNHDILISLVLVFLLFFLINRITATYLANKQFYYFLDVHLADTVSYTKNIFKEYEKTLPWLISYWSEHYEEMDIPRNGFSEKKYSNILNEWDKGRDMFFFDEEDLNSLSDEDKKKYAEVCYLMIADRIDYLADAYENMEFFCTRNNVASNSEIILFLGMNYSNIDPYKLGTSYEVESTKKEHSSEISIDGEKVRSYYVTASTEMIPKTPDNLVDNRIAESERGIYSYYVMSLPIYDKDNNEIALVSVGYDRQLVDKEIKNNILVSDMSIIIHMILICATVIFMMRRKVIKPLESVSNAVNDYIRTKNSSDVAGDLDLMINASRKTEIEKLAENFYDMSFEIDKYTEEIRISAAEKQRKKSEMDMARMIQIGQLPSISKDFNERKEFELFASMAPAREVGGDFYDFFMIDEDHLVLVIADVSDKGVPAALFMMTSKTLLRSELKGGKSLGKAVAHVNDRLEETNAANMFVTVWAAIVELSTGNVKSINAGHELPAIKRGGGTWELIDMPHDLPVACMPQTTFTENEWAIKPGDYLFVYTDGVPDATNEEGELFGTDRMTEVLNQCNKKKPEEIIQAMKSKIAEFEGSADAYDDTTMLCITFK